MLVLEALIAGLLFATVVGLAATSSAYHERALRKFQDRNAATFLAEREMEEALAQGYLRLPTHAAAYPQVFTISRTLDSQVQTVDYRCELSTTDSPEGNLRTVVVTVFYPDNGTERSVRLETDVYWTE